MSLKSVGASGLELIRSCADPLRQTFLPRPTKGWPCEISGPRPFARSSSLLVDPGDICPPQWQRREGEEGEGGSGVKGQGSQGVTDEDITLSLTIRVKDVGGRIIQITLVIGFE
jgi:hypothetical protein